MSNKISEKKILQINESGRKFSDTTILMHELIAHKAGLNGADHKYLSILLQNGSMMAGDLATHTGLTTGAITGVIDRLEKRGLVERKKEAQDRRKVIIEPNKEKSYELLGNSFQILQTKVAAMFSQYTNAELGIIEKFMAQSTEMMHSVIEELKIK
jgi:DNA-binding MarR family transcriptional regulator